MVELCLEHSRQFGQWSLPSKGSLEQLNSQQTALHEQEVKAQGRWRCSNAQVSEYLRFRNTDVTNAFVPVAPVLHKPQILRPVKIRTVQMASAGTFLSGISWTVRSPCVQHGAGRANQTLPGGLRSLHMCCTDGLGWHSKSAIFLHIGLSL